MVRRVMKEELSMKYKKLAEISMKGNSINNFILRQQWALKFIEFSK